MENTSEISDKYYKIRELMRSKNLSIEQFSALIGVGKYKVINWFQGKSKIDIDIIETIAEKLGVSVSYFFDGRGAKKTNENEPLLRELLDEKNRRIELLEDKLILMEKLYQAERTK